MTEPVVVPPRATGRLSPVATTRGRCNGLLGSIGGTPLDAELLPVFCAVAEVHVDQGLIGHTGLLAEVFEVGERRLIDPERDLLLQSFGVGVSAGLGEIVMLSHGVIPLA